MGSQAQGLDCSVSENPSTIILDPSPPTSENSSVSPMPSNSLKRALDMDYTKSPNSNNADSKPTRPRLPAILLTRHIDLKNDQILLFNILDVTDTSLASISVSNVLNTDPSNTTPGLDLALKSNMAPIHAIPAANPPTQVPLEYSEYADVFERRNAEKLLPHCPNVDHEIPLIDGVKPTYGPIYNLSELELKTLKEYIDRMLAKGFICPSKSPFRSPVLFVKRADGSLRLCVDYRKLNDITIKNRYPLSLISELFDCLKHAKVYSRLDLQDAYNQLRIARGDE